MFTLIELPYTMEALEPVISAQTLSFHHGKHLQAYVDNLNKLLPGSEFEGMALEEIVRKAPAGPVFNIWHWRRSCERLLQGRYSTMLDRY